MIGIVVTLAISLMITPILSGPVEQFAPIASAPNDSSTMAAVFASVPNKVLPSDSNVNVTMTGKSHTSFAAINAALDS